MNKHLKWRLRRGVLELDHVLHAFYEAHYEQLSAQLKDDFFHLLESPDPDLLDWLIYDKLPLSGMPYLQIVQVIRESIHKKKGN